MNSSRPIPRTAVSVIPPYHPGKRVTGAIKLSSNENPLGSSPNAIKAAKKALLEAQIYPDGRGTALIHDLSAQHRIPAENIILGNGSDEIMTMAAAAFIEPGSNAVIATPTFSQYEYSTRLFGGKVHKIPLVDGIHNLDAMAKAVDQSTRIVFVCNPNNPTGTYCSQAEIEAFLQKIPAHVLVVLDEAYCEYASASDFPNSIPMLSRYPNLLILRTFSKIYGLAALRLGYGFASAEIIDLFMRVKQPFNVNTPAIAAGCAALRDTRFVKKSLQLNRHGMTFLRDQLNRLKLDYYPSQANFICIHSPVKADVTYTHLLEYGITIRSLSSFGMDSSIRVSIGAEKPLRSLVAGLEALCR